MDSLGTELSLASSPGPSSERKGLVHTAYACAKITALFLVKILDIFNYHVDSTYGPRTTTDIAPCFCLLTLPCAAKLVYVAFLEDSRFTAPHFI